MSEREEKYTNPQGHQKNNTAIKDIFIKTNDNLNSETRTPIETNSIDNNNEAMNSLEIYQNKTLSEFYEIYLNMSNNTQKPDPELIKRSFEDYINFVESKYVTNIGHSFCDNNYDKCEPLLTNDTIIHKSHTKEHLDMLGIEFYALFKILDMVWKGEMIKKKDIVCLTPCRVFLLHSVIKRKFGEDLYFGLFNKFNS